MIYNHRYQRLAMNADIVFRNENGNDVTPDTQSHIERAKGIIDSLMDSAPSGSGFDAGTEIDLDRSNKNKLVFTTAFHHMDEFGYYEGWTHHEVIVKPDLRFGFEIKVTGRDKNEKGIKEYIADVFHTWLLEEI